MTPRSRRRCASRAHHANRACKCRSSRSPHAERARRFSDPRTTRASGSRRDLEPGLRVDKRILSSRFSPLRTRLRRAPSPLRRLKLPSGLSRCRIRGAIASLQGVMSSSTALYRAFLRASVKLTNYNFRQYARRRARLGFEENRDLQGARRDEEFQRGCEQLEMLRRCARPRCLPCAPRVHRCLTPKSRGRQAVIGSLYPPSLRSIMEG